MKANEFVKKFGWEKSKMAVKKLLPMGDGMPVFDYNSEDLKRLVESHEIVMSWGGLSDARAVSKMGKYYKYLKKAISDVESCL